MLRPAEIDSRRTCRGASQARKIFRHFTESSTMNLKELSSSTGSSFPPPARLAPGLWPHQPSGVEYAVRARRCLVGDEVGVGKTATAIAAVEACRAYPCLVAV